MLEYFHFYVLEEEYPEIKNLLHMTYIFKFSQKYD